MAAKPGTFRSSYGPTGRPYHLQYGEVISFPVSASLADSVVGMCLNIEVMNENPLRDPDLEKSAKTLAEDCCANNLLKWANDSGFKIERIDADDAISSKMETFNELTHSDPQPSVSVAMSLYNGNWLDDDESTRIPGSALSMRRGR